MGYKELPKPKSTPTERREALQSAQPMVSARNPLQKGKANALELIRLAEYITVGHDYFDTHPSDPERECKDDDKDKGDD